MLSTGEMSRRGFAAVVAGAFSAGVAGNWAVASAGDEAEGWAFPLLGDLHYDRLEHHDFAWLEKDHNGDLSQVRHYSKNTREVTPRLLEAAKRRALAATTPVPFVVQVGDLIEGLCGSEALARRQAADAIAWVRAAGFPAPFLFAKGNHDITGPGAARVYDDVLVPFLAGQAGGEIRAASYTRGRAGTLLAFYDAYDRNSLEWLGKLLEAEKPRRLLVVIHPPVVPYNARSTWHVYSHPNQAKQRDRLLDLLGRWRAVVLCGHLHKYSFLVRRTKSGRFVQLALSSVATDEQARPRDLLEGVDRYTPDLVDLEPKHSPETVARRREVLAAERPFIERFEYADTWGHALVTVRGDGVRAEIIRGLGQEPWKALDLTGPLG